MKLVISLVGILSQVLLCKCGVILENDLGSSQENLSGNFSVLKERDGKAADLVDVRLNPYDPISNIANRLWDHLFSEEYGKFRVPLKSSTTTTHRPIVSGSTTPSGQQTTGTNVQQQFPWWTGGQPIPPWWLGNPHFPNWPGGQQYPPYPGGPQVLPYPGGPQVPHHQGGQQNQPHPSSHQQGPPQQGGKYPDGNQGSPQQGGHYPGGNQGPPPQGGQQIQLHPGGHQQGPPQQIGQYPGGNQGPPLQSGQFPGGNQGPPQQGGPHPGGNQGPPPQGGQNQHLPSVGGPQTQPGQQGHQQGGPQNQPYPGGQQGPLQPGRPQTLPPYPGGQPGLQQGGQKPPLQQGGQQPPFLQPPGQQPHPGLQTPPQQQQIGGPQISPNIPHGLQKDSTFQVDSVAEVTSPIKKKFSLPSYMSFMAKPYFPNLKQLPSLPEGTVEFTPSSTAPPFLISYSIPSSKDKPEKVLNEDTTFSPSGVGAQEIYKNLLQLLKKANVKKSKVESNISVLYVGKKEPMIYSSGGNLGIIFLIHDSENTSTAEDDKRPYLFYIMPNFRFHTKSPLRRTKNGIRSEHAIQAPRISSNSSIFQEPPYFPEVIKLPIFLTRNMTLSKEELQDAEISDFAQDFRSPEASGSNENCDSSDDEDSDDDDGKLETFPTGPFKNPSLQ